MSKHTKGPWIAHPTSPGAKCICISGPQKYYPGNTFAWVDRDDVDHDSDGFDGDGGDDGDSDFA